MLSQRIYGLTLGYEDISDHEQLRNDPVFGILAGREELEKPLAGKSTLNRMELGAGTNYLPLYIICGEHVLCAGLREANHAAAFGSLQEIRRIVAQIRGHGRK